MTVKLWKMSIKTGGKRGHEAFEWCRGRGIVGVGWSAGYAGLTEVPAEPLAFLAGKDPQGVHSARKVLQDMQPGHFVWLHQRGSYFLCRVQEGDPLVAHQLGDEFLDYNIGHARRARWTQVPEDLVPGKVQRAVISPRMIHKIPASKRLAEYCATLHRFLERDADWRPSPELSAVRIAVTQLPREELVEFISPDDWEDIVAAYLQTQSWILVKSSCFHSKPRFEFRLIREQDGLTKTAYLQVKSGNVPLPPAAYARDVSAQAVVYLFSTHPTDPYPGEPVPGVIPLTYSALHGWMLAHVALLPTPLTAQLSLLPPASTEPAPGSP
jgi:hypothetical protein